MEAKQSPEKEEIIAGPLTLALSPTGVDSFVKRGQKLKKHRFFDGSEDFGLEMPSVVTKSFQKMTMTGMVSKVEQAVSDLVRQRRDLMALARCVAVATVYRQFETRLWEIINRNNLLIQWNRAHPRLVVGPGVNSAAPAFQALLGKAAEGILASKQEVLKTVQAPIALDTRTLPDEKKALTLLAIRYLNAIDPTVWLLLATSNDPFARSALVAELQKLLNQYVGRSELPEYLALMLVELVVVVGKYGCLPGASVVASADACADSVFISYELGTMKKSQEERTKVRVQVGNEANDFSDLKVRFDQTSGSRKSLDAFMAGGRRDGSGGDAAASFDGASNDMGLYYLSCLKEACKKMDISLDSFVNIVPHTKRTLINLILTV